ncbi:MAG: hypothetical protein QOD57_1220 [Actinomycetota bacterium]|nr:hypothetical protein [Actinomycetota bacterium]
MGLHDMTGRLEKIGALDRVAAPLAAAAKKAIGPGRRKDLLSGVGLGHPLHPVLTDVPIGAFTGATLLDLAGRGAWEPAVQTLLGAGLLAALPTAAAGLADWSDTYGGEQRVGVVHAAGNVAALALFGASLAARRAGAQGLGRTLGLAGMGVLGGSAYLGGYLTFARGVGVNNAFNEAKPTDWTPVLEEAQLAEGKPVRVEAGGTAILLFRTGGRIFAIGNRCTHAGGPLDEGEVDPEALCVTCPWHGSVFRLEDGQVVHGPASVPEAAYDVRSESGRIEVRVRH